VGASQRLKRRMGGWYPTMPARLSGYLLDCIYSPQGSQRRPSQTKRAKEPGRATHTQTCSVSQSVSHCASGLLLLLLLVVLARPGFWLRLECLPRNGRLALRLKLKSQATNGFCLCVSRTNACEYLGLISLFCFGPCLDKDCWDET
jgi:hypothetical protein